ncbi:MAG: DNA polymerase III subunit beta, partial [Candidatus Brocadiales bacterium]
GKGGIFKMAGYDPKEFPTIPAFSEKGSMEIEAKELAEMIRKVSFACASERVRHTMTGVLFQVEGGVLKMVATDGRRLAWVRERGGEGERGLAEGIVPRKGVEQLARIAEQQGGKIRLKIEETYLLAKGSKAMLCAQLIEGQYPNYKEAIPENNDKKMEIDVETLTGAIRRAAVLTTEERRLIRLGLRKGKIAIEAATPDVGEARVDIDVDYSGEGLDIGFNPNFLLDALKAIGKGTAHLEFKEDSTAAVIKGGQEFIYVVMPIRLTEAT